MNLGFGMVSKSTALVAALLVSQVVFAAAKTQVKVSQETTTVAPVAQVSSEIAMKPATKNIHIMTNLMGLSTGKTDLQANLFAYEKVAVSLGYGSKSEEAKLINQTIPSEQKVTVATNLYTVGAAFYILDHSTKYNFIINPLAAFQRRSDVRTVKTEGGIGLKLDAMYKLNNVAMNTGFQSTMIDGNSNTDFMLGVGYLF